MAMNEQERANVLAKISATLQDNLGNRLTVALANGVLHELSTLLPAGAPVPTSALPELPTMGAAS